MKIKLDDISLNISCKKNELTNKTPILFLHGFTGNLKDWEFVKGNLDKKFTPIFIDLIGHGNSSAPRKIEKYNSDNQIELIRKLLIALNLKKVILVGYSMGGRLALSFTAKYPSKVNSLVLISTAFGFENKSEREERIKSDKVLSKQVKNSTIEEFIKYWINIPLFKSYKKLSKNKIETLAKDKIKRNRKVGMQNSLLGFSTGLMKNYFPKLGKIKTKTLLVCGELDKKFIGINKKAVKLLPNAKLKIVRDTGHNLPFQKPKEFLKLLELFLKNI